MLWHDNSSFALDWLNENRTDIWIFFEHSLEVLNIIVFEKFESISEWAKLVVSGWIVAGA